MAAPERAGTGVTGDDVLRTVTATVDHLRFSTGPPGEPWTPCQRLVDEPDELVRLVAGTMAGRGTDRLDVAVSLFVQGYAYRVASAAVGAWLVADAVLDVSSPNTSIGWGRDRPNALRLHEARLIPSRDPLVDLHRVLIDEHLAPLLASSRRVVRIGEKLLWGNVASSIVSCFGAFDEPWPERRGEVRRRLEVFLQAGRPELAAAGRVVPAGARWVWERTSCCLWYRTDGGFRCQDCSLWSADERQQRYAAMAAEDGTR